MEQRMAYVEALSAQMVAWDVQIERLQEQADNATPEEKFEYSKAIGLLQLKRDEAAIKLQGLSRASDDEWQDLKTGADQIFSEIRSLLSDAIKKSG